MRKLVSLAVATTAVAAVACGRGKTPTSTSMSADLKRDLQLASATQNLQISPDEVTPKSHQEMAVRPKRDPKGDKVIRSEHPTVKASAKPLQAAEIKTDIPQVQVMASNPAPSETPSPDLPPLARPAPVPTQAYPSTGHIPDQGQGSAGGVWGSIFRGGILGDGDDCDPRGAHRGRGSDIYRGGMGGVGTMGRWPMGIPR